MGKLSFPSPPEDYLPRERNRHGIAALAIEEPAFTHLAKLLLLHRDPFDRILIAQALQYDLTIATVDDAVTAYSVKLLSM